MKDKKYKDAQSKLKEISLLFKQKEEHEKWLECELLLAECSISKLNVQYFFQYYSKEVEDKAKAVGLELRGKTVANSEWRIYQQLWNNQLSHD